MSILSENLIREISAARDEPTWLRDWRMDAFRAWQRMTEPHWGDVQYAPIDYEGLNYFNRAAPVDNSDLKETYEKMGLPESEQRALMGMATDTVIDSMSVHTSYTDELKKHGIIFLPFSDAVQQHPALVKKYLGTVVGATDNFFAALNAAVFSDGTFVYVPPNTKCPIDLASYFRIETAKIGQFERTLIIADAGAELSYMEGCSAPRRPNHQLHSGVVEVVAHPGAHVKYATVQNWYAGVRRGNKNEGGILNFVTKRGRVDENARLDWTQVEIGSALTWKYPSSVLAGRGAKSDFYSLAITRGAQMADTGTKMIHAADDTVSNIVSYGVALDRSRQTFRSLVAFSGRGGRNVSKCDTRLIGGHAIANTVPTIIHNNGENQQSHEAATGALDVAQMLYLARAGIAPDAAAALLVGATAAPVLSRLPMEFLVESKQLIQMALAQ